MEAFLYALSKSQGADQTLAAQYGSSAARNGEPFGEIGLVLSQDAAWGQQTGSPRDPQGPLSNARRDVNPSAGTQPIYETADAPPPVSLGAPVLLTNEQLAAATIQAKQFWSQELGAGDARLALLDSATVEVGNLPDLRLGATIGGLVLIDSDAAGYGWSLGSASNDRMDLLTAVKHELGHLLGFDHDDNGLMSETLAAGQRELASPAPTQPSTSTKLIDWTQGLSSTLFAWNSIGQRERGAGFPEFSMGGSREQDKSKSSSVPHKKRRYDLYDELAVSELTEWKIEG